MIIMIIVVVIVAVVHVLQIKWLHQSHTKLWIIKWAWSHFEGDPPPPQQHDQLRNHLLEEHNLWVRKRIRATMKILCEIKKNLRKYQNSNNIFMLAQILFCIRLQEKSRNV